MLKNKIMILSVMVITLGLLITSCGNNTNPAQATTAKAQVSQASSDSTLKTFTLEELKKYDGQNGNPAYVAVNGKVYDVSNVPQWANGQHHGLKAGVDQSEAIKKSPHGLSVLDKLTVVGKLAGN